jgi:hypothetical protein
MSTIRTKSKVRRKPLKHAYLSGSIRQKKRERSEIRKESLHSHESSKTPSIEEVNTEMNDSLSPVLEECVLPKTGSTNYTGNDLRELYNPAAIFPFSNKPHETREKTIAEESKQWESFFDPQHTFDSFHTTLAKQPNQHYFYQGKWPLDQEDLMGMIPKKQKDDDTFLFPTVPSPTLPNTDHLQIHTTTPHAYESEEYFDGNTSIEILPCPSLSSFPKFKKREMMENEAMVWKSRLELLSTIQKEIFDETWNGTQTSPFKESTAARLQRQIKKKAERMKRETLVDSETDEEEEKELSVVDSWENISFHAKKNDVENQHVVEVVKRKNRPSFLLFAYGFLFPPLWVVGAFYCPRSSQTTTTSKKIDMKWKKYSRNAFLTFFVLMVAMIVLILALKPEAVGFRNSHNEDYQNEEKIIFDDLQL